MSILKDVTLAAIESQISKDVDAFNRSHLAAASLAGIERNGSPEDAALVRPFLKGLFGRDVAIRALSRIGGEEDVPALTRAATEVSGQSKIEAARAALRLSKGSEEVIQTLLRAKDSDLVRLALSTIESSKAAAWMCPESCGKSKMA